MRTDVVLTIALYNIGQQFAQVSCLWAESFEYFQTSFMGQPQFLLRSGNTK